MVPVAWFWGFIGTAEKLCMGLFGIVADLFRCSPGGVLGWSWCRLGVVLELGLSKNKVKNEKQLEREGRRGVSQAAQPAIT